MITELRIAGLGVIDDATVELDPGLTVVTGETGAGKTMIVSGLSLLLGDRADARSIRVGADRARVEGRFSMTDGDDPRLVELGATLDGDELLVARTLTTAGRSRCQLGGAQVPVSVCADVVSELVTIHGQSEQIRLQTTDRQREILDRFAGHDELAGYRTAWTRRRTVAAELDRLRGEAQARAREIGLIRFGLDEIDKVDPQPDEDVELAAEALRLQASDDLRLAAHTAISALSGDEDDTAAGALSAAVAARRALADAVDLDPTLAPLTDRAAEIAVLTADLAADLSGYLADLDADPARLETIAERRAALSTLTRKYGSTVAEVLRWSSRSAQRLIELSGSDDRIDELADQVDRLDTELAERSGRLATARRAAAEALADRVRGELADLAMPHARLTFSVTPADELGPTGADRIELLFTANPGSEPRPLGKVASGGELSRVRLALEVVLAGTEVRDGHGPATLVFDEVDAGVGGRVAVAIGRRLATLAKTNQVVVVTHLAQVAAFADRHWMVVKSDDGQVTTSGVREVTSTDRATELARMMAGLETTDSALAHAGELLELAAAHRTG